MSTPACLLVPAAGLVLAAAGTVHAQPVVCLAWSADGKYIAAGARYSEVRVYDSEGELVLQIENDQYGAVVSAGTFTHGHVGPAAFGELLRVTKPGGLFVIGINATAFDKYEFGSALARLSADGRIGELHFRHVQYYENADDEHQQDHRRFDPSEGESAANAGADAERQHEEAAREHLADQEHECCRDEDPLPDLEVGGVASWAEHQAQQGHERDRTECPPQAGA